MLIENGTVRTLDRAKAVVTSLGIDGQHIVAHAEALERVDLRGRCVLPGFNDAHVHFPTWALAQSQVDLDGATSLEDATDRIREAIAGVRPGQLLRGYGWRSAQWADQPTRQVLDRLAGDIPVALISKDYHSLWLSSSALARAKDDLQVPGGVVETDDRGEVTGILRERSAWHFRDRYMSATDDEYVDAMRAGIGIAAARGVTAVHDKDGWLGALRLWSRLRAEGALSIRVWQTLPHDKVEDLRALGLASGFGDDSLRLGHLKVFMDGALGSQTAHMLDGSGVEITTRPELVEMILQGVGARFPLAVHAIGDRANREALSAFEETHAAWSGLGLRQRIEHAQLVAPDDIGRFARIGVAASVQFSHAPSDRDLADELWAGKTAGAYAYRSLARSGAILANGSDAPVEELDPLAGIRAGVLRTLDERPPWQPEEALTVEEALEATCVAPAWLAGDEHRRGRLMPGYVADLVVLDRDPVACATEELVDVRVVATMVGGRWVHNPPPWD